MKRLLFPLAALALLVAACGGSGPSVPPAASKTPDLAPAAFQREKFVLPPNFSKTVQMARGDRLEVRFVADDVIRVRVLDPTNVPVADIQRGVLGEGSVVAEASGTYTMIFDTRFAPGGGLRVEMAYRVVPASPGGRGG